MKWLALTVTQERMDRIKLSAPAWARLIGMNTTFKEGILVQMKFEGSIAAGDTGLGGARDALKHYFSDDAVIIWGYHHMRTRYDAIEINPFFECSSELKYNGLWQGRIMHGTNYVREYSSIAGAAYGVAHNNSAVHEIFFPNLMFPVEEDDYVQMDLGLNENTGAVGIASRSDMNFFYIEKP